ncbi:aminomethyl-transferring glycine dehydrogenase subunit GcvPB [Alkalibacterium thalassium]|uniref:Probable glycine dehydrogenase (decarboxylating) subunit 2 n=1 Tax=Alkalibacterium thalassium TaxID=426701 RepID=A0A1G9EK36_9LACT|nr:aminomethyl-transferring glycine dehydrogenase subunit GcvPB [Alkalibacterium thalassium]SDK76496.1 glycine dehydrogenase subunit 2 [Alkalibacterium thalassium]
MTAVYNDLLFEISRPGRKGYSLPESSVEKTDLTGVIPEHLIREDAAELPELSELQVMRHYTGLSNKNFGIETGFYPLGSCTMKYNPKVNEDIARYSGFAQIHPFQPAQTAQGALELMYRLEENLKEVTGMDAISLQPAAGAQGEWAGLLIFKAYHEANGEGEQRRKILVPDSAHGTNPASAVVAGYDVVEIKSNEQGRVGIDALKAAVGPDTAGLMLTNPNTLGLFEVDIVEIAEIVHEAGGLLYYDGANANAILGKSTPGEMGFDVVHLNLHKSFSTPHGGGGPGSGPIGVKDYLKAFMPSPRIAKEGDTYKVTTDHPQSIGRVKGYFGNFGVNVRAYSYIRSMGADGLQQVSEDAVLHANYLKARLEPYYDTPYSSHCKHEFVLSGVRQKKLGVRTLDIAKRLLDYGFYAPTVYFPLIVEECLMIEPTETEAKEQLDAFADAMIEIAEDAENNPETVTGAPFTKAVKRLDEVTAARKPVVTYQRD